MPSREGEPALAEIRLENVRKTFGRVVATRDVSLTIHDQEFMVLLGPSGCGKTTLLRGIAGLESIDQGRIHIGGREVTRLPPRKRQIAMVFQSYAVFPHLTVFENIAFGLRMQRIAQPQVQRRVQAAAELLHIEGLLDRYPAQVSGGQRQRVAVARAIAVQAEVLLMDEPLSNLDALLRLEMRAELKRLLKELKATTVYVTHDQVEALSLGDRIAVMKDGAILQCDAPLAVYDHPAAHFVGSFIGNPPMNFLAARVANQSGRLTARVGEAQLPLPEVTAREVEARSLEDLWLGIRAENVGRAPGPGEDTLGAEIQVVEPLGSHILITARAEEQTLKLNVGADERLEVGQTLWLRFAPQKIRWMDRSSGETLPLS